MLTDYERGEVREALEILQNMCDEIDICNDCELYVPEVQMCVFELTAPVHWNIESMLNIEEE